MTKQEQERTRLVKKIVAKAESLGYSATAVAERTGVPLEYINELLKGDFSSVNGEWMRRLLKSLNMKWNAQAEFAVNGAPEQTSFAVVQITYKEGVVARMAMLRSITTKTLSVIDALEAA